MLLELRLTFSEARSRCEPQRLRRVQRNKLRASGVAPRPPPARSVCFQSSCGRPTPPMPIALGEVDLFGCQ
jgi:hypothetical protein